MIVHFNATGDPMTTHSKNDVDDNEDALQTRSSGTHDCSEVQGEGHKQVDEVKVTMVSSSAVGILIAKLECNATKCKLYLFRNIHVYFLYNREFSRNIP